LLFVGSAAGAPPFIGRRKGTNPLDGKPSSAKPSYTEIIRLAKRSENEAVYPKKIIYKTLIFPPKDVLQSEVAVPAFSA
jgi:hypothetical protein